MGLTFIIYFVTLIFATFFSFLSKYSINSKAKLFLNSLSILILLLVSGLRSEFVGIDNHEYAEWFRSLSADGNLYDTILNNIVDFEPGFVVLNFLIKLLGFGYNFALLSYACLIWIPIYSFLKYQSDSFYISIFIFITLGVLFFTFNGQRQSIALGFVFLACRYIYEQKKIKFLLAILMASMFHFSAILMLTIYIINLIPKINYRIWVTLLFISLIMPINILFGIIGYVASLFPFYGGYIQSDKFFQHDHLTAGVLYQVILSFISVLYYKNHCSSKLEILIFHLFFIGSIGNNLFYGNLFLSRIVVYLLFFQPFVFSFIMINLMRRSRKMEVVGFCILFLIMFIYKIIFSDSGCSPYQFFI